MFLCLKISGLLQSKTLECLYVCVVTTYSTVESSSVSAKVYDSIQYLCLIPYEEILMLIYKFISDTFGKTVQFNDTCTDAHSQPQTISFLSD